MGAVRGVELSWVWPRAVMVLLAALAAVVLVPAGANAVEEPRLTLSATGESVSDAEQLVVGDTWEYTFTATNDTGATFVFPDALGLSVHMAFQDYDAWPAATGDCSIDGYGGAEGANITSYFFPDHSYATQPEPPELAAGEAISCTLTYTVTAADVEYGGLWAMIVFSSDWDWETWDYSYSIWVPAPDVDGWPSVRGAPAVGSELAAVLGFMGPWDREPTYQWLRDGAPIAGATGTTYTPVVADIGATLSVAVVGGTGLYLEATTDAPVVGLVDVATSAFFDEIAWFAAQGITTGYPNGDGTAEYRPFGNVTRDAMAAFLYRYAGSPEFTAPEVSPFTDVSPSKPFYTEICWLAETGITTGWDVGGGEKEFRPFATITRDAMAAFLYRFAGEPEWIAPAVSPFVDVAVGKGFYDEITWLADSGITTGWTVGGKKEFRPFASITRDAMAAFLYRFDALDA